MVARTLTQHAAPTTFGAKAAGWLNGVVDAFERLCALRHPHPDRRGRRDMGRHHGAGDAAHRRRRPGGVSTGLVQSTATDLGLDVRLPWHTTRTPVTAAADALRRLHRPLGPDRLGHRHPGPPGDRRTERAGRRGPRRIVVDAAQAKSGVVHSRYGGPPCRHRSWRRPCTPPPRWPTTSGPTAHGMPNGTPYAPWPAATVVAGSQCGELLAGTCGACRSGWPKTSTRQTFSGNNEVIAELAGKAPSATYFGAVDRLIDESLDRAQVALGQR